MQVRRYFNMKTIYIAYKFKEQKHLNTIANYNRL